MARPTSTGGAPPSWRSCGRSQVTEAAERELVRRCREGLLRSLKAPHPETAELAETGLADWGASLPAEHEELVDVMTGTPVRWVEGRGWMDEPL